MEKKRIVVCMIWNPWKEIFFPLSSFDVVWIDQFRCYFPEECSSTIIFIRIFFNFDFVQTQSCRSLNSLVSQESICVFFHFSWPVNVTQNSLVYMKALEYLKLNSILVSIQKKSDRQGHRSYGRTWMFVAGYNSILIDNIFY